jgi:hypothetical protein
MLPLYDIRLNDGDGYGQVTSQTRALQARLLGTPDLALEDLGTLKARLMNARHQIEVLEQWVKRFEEDELNRRWDDLLHREKDLAGRAEQ